MRHIEPKNVPVKEVFDYLLGGIGPRPVALVSTISIDDKVNLSPFSFFNAFGSNPPTVAFSPSRRLRDNTTKHTYENLKVTKECVIQAVTYAMIQQVSLASTEFAEGINEFEKSGLTPIPSDLVAPPRVSESPFQMECKLVQMIELGGKHASGNLAICEVVKFHIAEDIFVDGIINPNRIDLVARMGRDFYCRASGDAVFVVKKPITTCGVGYDHIPEFIRKSQVLTANNLGQLGNIERIPSSDEITAFIKTVTVSTSATLESFHRYERLGEYHNMLSVSLSIDKIEACERRRLLVLTAKRALDFDNHDFAWKTLLYSHTLK
ncbi:MAG: flavin reductase family protein [candidate division Zixibacteria bacterium]|nr:flavin reductase family protein [candidate division Zixibacteria bacterium]